MPGRAASHTFLATTPGRNEKGREGREEGGQGQGSETGPARQAEGDGQGRRTQAQTRCFRSWCAAIGGRLAVRYIHVCASMWLPTLLHLTASSRLAVATYTSVSTLTPAYAHYAHFTPTSRPQHAHRFVHSSPLTRYYQCYAHLLCLLHPPTVPSTLTLHPLPHTHSSSLYLLLPSTHPLPILIHSHTILTTPIQFSPLPYNYYPLPHNYYPLPYNYYPLPYNSHPLPITPIHCVWECSSPSNPTPPSLLLQNTGAPGLYRSPSDTLSARTRYVPLPQSPPSSTKVPWAQYCPWEKILATRYDASHSSPSGPS